MLTLSCYILDLIGNAWDLSTECIYVHNSACESIWDKSHQDLENSSQIQRAGAHRQPLRWSDVTSYIYVSSIRWSPCSWVSLPWMTQPWLSPHATSSSLKWPQCKLPLSLPASFRCLPCCPHHHIALERILTQQRSQESQIFSLGHAHLFLYKYLS